jgi:hypothetical protein
MAPMIVLPRGWALVNEADHVVLVHPAGRQVASIEYRERVHPLLKVGALVRRFLAHHPEFECRELPDCVERVMTAEGEFGALATLEGKERGVPAQRDLGFVFGDDFYALVSAVCYRAEAFDEVTRTVRELVASDAHALGVRRRRFEYAPPRGWQPLARFFVTDWLAPGYPRDNVYLTVYPANPVSVAPQNMLAALAGAGRTEQTRVERERLATLRTPSGLIGEIAEVVLVTGEHRAIKLCAVLQDPRYAYALEAQAQTDAQLSAHRREIEDVFTSVQPIPQPRDPARDFDLVAQSYWVE